MRNTILEAIKQGVWDFEPEKVPFDEFEACREMPGTPGKLLALAERVRLGCRCGTPTTARTLKRKWPFPSAAHSRRRFGLVPLAQSQRGRFAADRFPYTIRGGFTLAASRAAPEGWFGLAVETTPIAPLRR